MSSGKLDVGLYIMGTCVLGVSVSAHFRVKIQNVHQKAWASEVTDLHSEPFGFYFCFPVRHESRLKGNSWFEDPMLRCDFSACLMSRIIQSCIKGEAFGELQQ